MRLTTLLAISLTLLGATFAETLNRKGRVPSGPIPIPDAHPPPPGITSFINSGKKSGKDNEMLPTRYGNINRSRLKVAAPLPGMEAFQDPKKPAKKPIRRPPPEPENIPEEGQLEMQQLDAIPEEGQLEMKPWEDEIPDQVDDTGDDDTDEEQSHSPNAAEYFGVQRPLQEHRNRKAFNWMVFSVIAVVVSIMLILLLLVTMHMRHQSIRDSEEAINRHRNDLYPNGADPKQRQSGLPVRSKRNLRPGSVGRPRSACQPSDPTVAEQRNAATKESADGKSVSTTSSNTTLQ